MFIISLMKLFQLSNMKNQKLSKCFVLLLLQLLLQASVAHSREFNKVNSMKIIPGSNLMQNSVKSMSPCMTAFEKVKTCSLTCQNEIWIYESKSVEDSTKAETKENVFNCTKHDLVWFSQCIIECVYSNGDWNIIIYPESI
ncbi:hypothetical protein ACKWTF_000744 [Chironomus riparius]